RHARYRGTIRPATVPGLWTPTEFVKVELSAARDCGTTRRFRAVGLQTSHVFAHVRVDSLADIALQFEAFHAQPGRSCGAKAIRPLRTACGLITVTRSVVTNQRRAHRVRELRRRGGLTWTGVRSGAQELPEHRESLPDEGALPGCCVCERLLDTACRARHELRRVPDHFTGDANECPPAICRVRRPTDQSSGFQPIDDPGSRAVTHPQLLAQIRERARSLDQSSHDDHLGNGEA